MMKMKEILNNIRINKIGHTIMITGKGFLFSYTPVQDIIKPEHQKDYRYFGGLQHDYTEMEGTNLENYLIEICENLLNFTK